MSKDSYASGFSGLLCFLLIELPKVVATQVQKKKICETAKHFLLVFRKKKKKPGLDGH